MRRTTTILLLATAGLTFGCDRDDPIKTYQAPKEQGAALPVAKKSADRSADITWTLPTGWKEVAPGSMQEHAFAVSDDPALRLTVSILEGRGGGLLANINRWEDQIGAERTEATDLDRVIQHTDVGPLHVDVVDLTGKPGQAGQPQLRTLAAIVEQPERTWFFKLSGPKDQVEKQKASFDAFVKSFRSTGAASADPHEGHDHDEKIPATKEVAPSAAPQKPAEGAGQTGSAGAVSWKLPTGWEQDAKPRMMREATFFAGPADAKAEVTIMKFPLESFQNDPAGNVNRWRGQVGLPPSQKPLEDNVPQKTRVGESEAVEFTFANPQRKIAMRLIMVQRGDTLYYFKILGPEKTVQEQKDALAGFLSSVRIAQ